MKRLLLLACLPAAFALSACGGSDDSAAVAEIRADIHAAASVHDTTTCHRFATQRFLEGVTGANGADALHICEEEAEDPSRKAKSVKVSAVAVDGDQASARVTFGGLPASAPETVVVSLLEGGGHWRLDSLDGFAPGGKPRSAHPAPQSYPALTAEDKRCVDRVAAKTSSAEYLAGLRAAGFSGSRYQDDRAACVGTHATAVSPPGASFAFAVPPGFEAAPPVKEDEGFFVSLSAPATRHEGAGLSVNEQVLTPDLGQLGGPEFFRDVKVAFEAGIQEEERELGATESAVEPIRVGAHRGIRWVVANGRSKPFPGTDTQTVVLFDIAARRSVRVSCIWGRDQTESSLIQDGCEALLHSLRLN